MISEIRQPISSSNADFESRTHDQRDRAMCEGFNGKGKSVGDASGDSNVNFRKKKARQDEDMALQDVYYYPDGLDDDDDDDDSNCDPLEKPATDVCGEHKESEILKCGFFASPFSKEAGFAGPQGIEREEIRKHKVGLYT